MNERVVVQDLGEWVAYMEWPEGIDNGGPGRLVIEPANPEAVPFGGLSSTVLRQVDFKEAIAKFQLDTGLVAELEDMRDARRKGREDARAGQLRTALADGVTENYLALLASEYVRAVNAGTPKPYDKLAEWVGKTPSTIRGHLWQARKKGLLTGSPGKAGGQLTPQARKILGISEIAPTVDEVEARIKAGFGN